MAGILLRNVLGMVALMTWRIISIITAVHSLSALVCMDGLEIKRDADEENALQSNYVKYSYNGQTDIKKHPCSHIHLFEKDNNTNII